MLGSRSHSIQLNCNIVQPNLSIILHIKNGLAVKVRRRDVAASSWLNTSLPIWPYMWALHGLLVRSIIYYIMYRLHNVAVACVLNKGLTCTHSSIYAFVASIKYNNVIVVPVYFAGNSDATIYASISSIFLLCKTHYRSSNGCAHTLLRPKDTGQRCGTRTRRRPSVKTTGPEWAQFKWGRACVHLAACNGSSCKGRLNFNRPTEQSRDQCCYSKRPQPVRLAGSYRCQFIYVKKKYC